MKLARDCDCLVFSGKSFHRYDPVILSDFFLLIVRVNEIPSAERLAVLVLHDMDVRLCAKVILEANG